MLCLSSDLLQMGCTALMEPKGFWQGSVLIWEMKSFEGLSVQVKKWKLLNYVCNILYCLLWVLGCLDFKMPHLGLMSLLFIPTINIFLAFCWCGICLGCYNVFFLLWITRWKARDDTIIELSVLRNRNFWMQMVRGNCKCIRNRGDFEEWDFFMLLLLIKWCVCISVHTA